MSSLFDNNRNNAFAAFLDSQNSSPLGGDNLLASLLSRTASWPAVPPQGLAAALLNSQPTLLGGLLPTSVLAPEIKRKVYFAFKFDDVMRVNNVRNAWKIVRPDNALFRSFYDSSIWEKSRAEGDDALKGIMREGVQYTSAVCVLIGSDTWQSRWVRYEIARAIVDKRGLLAVHLNHLNHHKRQAPDPLGPNPLAFLGIHKNQNGSFDIYERRLVGNLYKSAEWQWLPYRDYTLPVSLPKFLAEPEVGFVRPLSVGTAEYDYVVGEGNRNIGAWIDAAANAVDR